MGSEDLAYSACVIWIIIMVLYLELDNPWSVLLVLYGKQKLVSQKKESHLVWIDMRENDKRELSLIKLHFFYSYYILAHRR